MMMAASADRVGRRSVRSIPVHRIARVCDKRQDVTSLGHARPHFSGHHAVQRQEDRAAVTALAELRFQRAESIDDVVERLIRCGFHAGHFACRNVPRVRRVDEACLRERAQHK